MMDSFKNKTLLFLVRQTLGRIVKDIQSDQLEILERVNSSLGVSFELTKLELDEVFINNLIGVGPDGSGLIRLAHGYVNSFRGNLSVSTKGPRAIDIDGLQLVFDVTPQAECAVPTGKHKRDRSQRDYEPPHDMDMGASPAGGGGGGGGEEEVDDRREEMFSSLFMSDAMRKEVEDNVVLPALRESADATSVQTSVMISEGIKVFERNIKQLAHSVSGSIRNVNIILRIPPHGQRITPGEEPPEGTLELLISFQGGFELEDMHSDPESNVMRKRIRFSNLRLAVYPYDKRRTTYSNEEEVEESVDLGSVFLCSGRADDLATNDLVLQFGETRGTGVGPEAFFNAKVTIKSFISVLSPIQLSRLVYIARALVGAPTGDRTDADESTVNSRSVKFTTTMRATCQYISCTLMMGEDAEGTKAFWESLQRKDEEKNEGDIDNAFLSRQHRLDLQHFLHSTPYYNIYLGGILLLLQPFTASTNSTEDAYHDVFVNHGGRGCSIGISIVEVYERYGKSDRDSKGGRLILTTKRTNDTQPERRYRIAIVSRTTYPLTLAEAQKYNCVPSVRPSDGGKNSPFPAAVVVEHILVKTSGALLLGELDAGVIERLGNFWAQMQSILIKVSQTAQQNQQEQQQQQQSMCKGDLMGEGSNEATMQSNLMQRFGSLRPIDAEDMAMYEQMVIEGQSFPTFTDDVHLRGGTTLYATTPYLFQRAFTLQLEGTTVEMKFAAANVPDPDYYGPLTRRLWEHLRDEGVAFTGPGAKVPPALGGADAPYLPLTMSVYLRGLDVSVDSGGKLELFICEGQLTLHDYMEGTQSNILRCVFDTAGEKSCISINQRKEEQTTGMSAGPWSVPRKAHPPFSDAYMDTERLAESTCLIKVVANIKQIDAHFRQDEFLLTMFYLDQVVEAVDRLCTAIGPTSTARASTTSKGTDDAHDARSEEDIILTRMAVWLKVDNASATLWAPRLSSAGVAIGEPLWRCIPAAERCRIDEEHLRHRYEITVSKVNIFVHHETSAILLKTAVHGQGSNLFFRERLCQATLSYFDFPWPAEHPSAPKWGDAVTLLQSYSEKDNEANVAVGRRPGEQAATAAAAVASTTAPSNLKNRQPLAFSLCRHRNIDDRTEAYDMEVQLNRVCVNHRAAHDGDHWFFVILNFFSDAVIDAPMMPNEDSYVSNSQKAENDEGKSIHEKVTGDGDDDGDDDDGDDDDYVDAVGEVADDTQSEYGVLIATSANIRVILIDSLIEYKPFGKCSSLVGLAPRLKLDITVPSVLSETTSVLLFLDNDTASIFLNNDFQRDLLDNDRELRPVSSFGSGNHGIATDLKHLGYVLVLDVRSAPPKSGSDPIANVALYVNLTSEKPLYIEVQGLRTSTFFASDSLYYFRVLLSHYFGGFDTLFIPSPNILVQHSGPYFEYVIQHESQQEATSVVVHQLVPDYAERLDELLKSSAMEITVSHDPNQDTDDESIKSNAPSSLDDFYIIDSNECETPSTPLASPRLTVTWKTCDNVPVDLTKCYTQQKFLSVQNTGPNPTVSRRYAPRRTPLGIPIAVELYLFDCDVAAHLYGGVDFRRTDVPQVFLQTMRCFGVFEEPDFRSPAPDAKHAQEPWSGMNFDTELWRGWHEGHHNGLLGGGRRREEYIIGRVMGIRMQVDLFSPGRDRFMQLHVDVRDIEVIDCIEGSSVQTLFMSTLPRELRDHDSDILELRWTTFVPRSVAPHAGILVVGKPEEEIVVRLQPVTVAVHRRAIDLIPRFFEAPEAYAEGDAFAGHTLTTEPFFFRTILIYPVQVTLYVHFEGQRTGPMARGFMFELCNYILPSIERAEVLVPLIYIEACPAELVGDKVLDKMCNEITKFHGIFMLCCGFQPLQLASDVSSAGVDMLITPLKDYQRNKKFFSAVSRALRRFLQTLVAQSLHGAASFSMSLENTAASSITYLSPATDLQPLSRGSQPINLMDGLRKGFEEFTRGFHVASCMTAYCLGPDGNPVRLPVAAPVIMDGFLRGAVQMFRGMRNTVAPEMYYQERKVFKGNYHKIEYQ